MGRLRHANTDLPGEGVNLALPELGTVLFGRHIVISKIHQSSVFLLDAEK